MPAEGRAAPALRAAFPLFRPLATRWADNDIYGHMNNVVHYALFDTAVNGWLAERGFLDPLTSPTFGIVAETGCRYHAEMAFPDRVTAGLRVGHLGTRSLRWEIALFRNDDDSAAAEGFFVHVWVDRASRRPVPLPDGLRRAATDLQSASA